jgi:hypothetical protein
MAETPGSGEIPHPSRIIRITFLFIRFCFSPKNRRKCAVLLQFKIVYDLKKGCDPSVTFHQPALGFVNNPSANVGVFATNCFQCWIPEFGKPALPPITIYQIFT